MILLLLRLVLQLLLVLLLRLVLQGQMDSLWYIVLGYRYNIHMHHNNLFQMITLQGKSFLNEFLEFQNID